MSISDSKIKKYIFLIGLILSVALIACAGLVIYIDPFFHYHKPLDGFDYVIDNQLNQNPGMAVNFDYDSVILGSSMTVNFETDWFAELMDLNTLKLSYSSAYPKDISNILEKIYGPSKTYPNRTVKKVFLGLDVITYSGGIDETKYPLPEYLYDRNPINDVKYLWNKDVLLNYCLRPAVNPETLNLSHIYASWWTDDYYNEDWVLQNHDMIKEKKTEKLDDHAFEEPIRRNLETNIIPYIEAHPETEFVIFYPPYSILFWNDVIMDNRLEATKNSYLITAKLLNRYDNVKMYFFPSLEDVVCDLNNYADYSHYHPDINRYMTECFVNENGLVAKENQEGVTIEEYLNRTQEMIDNYDFEELNQKLLKYHPDK